MSMLPINISEIFIVNEVGNILLTLIESWKIFGCVVGQMTLCG